MKKAAVFLYIVFTALAVYGQSEVVVYRADMPTNAGFKCRVYIDGRQRLVLGNGESGTVSVSNGRHTIQADLYTLKTERLEFTAGAGALSFTITPYSVHEFTIARGGGGSPVYSNNGVEGSLVQSADRIAAAVPANSKIAVVHVEAPNPEVAEFIYNELEFLLVDRGLRMIDRRQLDIILQEQKLQRSGMIDDREAVRVGKMAGAGIIITGEVTGTGSLRRLRLRALDAESAEIVTMTSQQY
ncbi:MAG: CsgG/HfaB family protein [Treponema sp.]|jgi:hypothetical protein|nr:CsgG/HfaB family protein [Treponema sp.]